MKEKRYRESEVLREKLLESQNILILTHVNPDGDAIGSTLAMSEILKKLGKKSRVITPNDFPDFLHWMEGTENILVYFRKEKTVKKLAEKADLILCIDFSDSRRLEKAEDVIINSAAFKILIDHHPDPAGFTDMIISDTLLGSSAEIIYHLIKDMGFEHLIDKPVAENLYTGIMTDTGNFSFASSYSEIWCTVASLIKKGIDKDKIYSLVYDNYSEKRMRMMGYCLYENMDVYDDYHTAVIALSQEELERFDHKPGDTEGFVNLPFSIRGLKLSALFLEKNDHIRISLRSRGDFSVNELSRKHLNGGGHTNAAGGELKMPLKDAVEKFREILENYKEELQ
ncbi:MAG: DHH family phosphoesterase [Bacteroidota bacterium]